MLHDLGRLDARHGGTHEVRRGSEGVELVRLEVPLVDLHDPASAERDGHRHGDALDAVLALEDYRCRPELSVTVQRGDHARDAEAGRPRGRPPGVEPDVDRIPRAEVLLGGPCLVGRGADRGAVHGDAVEQRHGLVAVLAEHPGLDAARRGRERLREARPQAQAVVDRVADDPPAVEAGAPPDACHQGVDGVGDHHHDALPRRPERVRELVGDQGVPRQVLDAGRSGGDRCRREQHHDVRIGHVVHVAAAHAAPGRELQHLVEVHHVRRDHVGPAVDEDDLVGEPRQDEVERGRCAHAAGATDDRDLHDGHRPGWSRKNQIISL